MHFTLADWIPLVLIVGVIALWIDAEFGNHKALRITCGVLMVFMLTGAWFHARQRLAMSESEMTSAVSHIAAAMDEGDTEFAHRAMRDYARVGGRTGARNVLNLAAERDRAAKDR